jgi:DNA-binding response OmpR family regulator
MTHTLLVVDDKREMVDLVKAYLTEEGFRIVTAYDGQEALFVARETKPDLILLDLMMPNMGGYDFIRTYTREAATPIIILTARLEESDKVLGLELGADDYITKPFSAQELVLRVGAVLRRVRAEPMTAAGRVLRSGSLVVDLAGPTVSANGEAIDLTPTELRLLIALMERKGRVQTRRQLLESAWNVSAAVETRTVDMHIQRLRARLGTASDHIETVRGIGYRFRGD